jgi:SAM-dependent methyltransferase
MSIIGADARRQTEMNDRPSLGTDLEIATVLRAFLQPPYRLLAICLLNCLFFSSSPLHAQDLLAWGQQKDSLDIFKKQLAPSVGTPERAVQKILEVANLKRGETLYDLGCMDGRILLAAVKHYQVNAVGIELSEHYARKAAEEVKREGFQNRIKVIHGDFMKTDLSGANVVTLYLATAANETVRPNLEKYLKPNTRVVSYDYPIPGWKAIQTFDTEGDLGDTHVIYLYQVPASIVNKK